MIVDTINGIIVRLETLEQNVANLKLQTREFDYDGTHPEAVREQVDAANNQLEELTAKMNAFKGTLEEQTGSVWSELAEFRTRIRTLEKAREADKLKQDIERDAKAELEGRGAKWGYGRIQKGSPERLSMSFAYLRNAIVAAESTPENLAAIEAHINLIPSWISEAYTRMKRELEHNRERDLLKRVYDGIRAGSHYVSLSTEDYEQAVTFGYIDKDRKLSKLGAVLIRRILDGKL